MSNKLKYRSPQTLLEELGIEEPEEIDIEAIAQYCNATILYESLYGCDARIIGNGDRAIITINNKVSSARQRFSAAHELGHWIRDRDKNAFACAEDVFLKEWSEDNPERQANRYAADLILPESMFKNLAKNREITFETVKKLSEQFQTSLTATAIRLVELGSFPAILVCAESKKRRWFIRGSEVPEYLWPVPLPGPASIANHIFHGKTHINPDEVKADNWIMHESSFHYYLHEDSIKINNDLVLSLLWWKDEQQIIDLDEDNDLINDNWELKWK